jgi:hypothetical protein
MQKQLKDSTLQHCMDNVCRIFRDNTVGLLMTATKLIFIVQISIKSITARQMANWTAACVTRETYIIATPQYWQVSESFKKYRMIYDVQKYPCSNVPLLPFATFTTHFNSALTFEPWLSSSSLLPNQFVTSPWAQCQTIRLDTDRRNIWAS